MKTAKKEKSLQMVPTAKPVSLPSASPVQVKRGRGRPRKNPLAIDSPVENKLPSLSKASEDPDEHQKIKAIAVFRKAMADAEKLNMSGEEFDGGGTAENAHSVTKESLQRRVTRRLNVLDRFLTDDKLIELLAMSSLKEIGVYEGIMLDKSLVLQGQPTVIIGNDERATMTDMLPRLMNELKRRGMLANSNPKHALVVNSETV